ncbi:FGGY-family carbohydrate kinase [soil metagenome]
MLPEAALGFDVGTTSVKAGLLWVGVDRPVEMARRPYGTQRPSAGWSQQEPGAWVAAMAACWTELHERVGPVRLLSVGICSQVNTHVIVDASLAPVHPAITWQDIRSAAEAAELDARIAGRRTELWGGPFTVDASFSLARAAWLARHEPAAWSAARWIMSPKDFCVATLSGEVVTDTISPVGLVGPDGRYLDGVVDLVPGIERLLPPLRRFDEPAGTILEGNPVGLPANVTVAVGTMDAWGNVYGSGVVRSGRAMEVAGTSEILGVLSDGAIPTQGVISFAPVDGRHLHAAPTQSGGDALEWAARCFSSSVPELLAHAAEARQDRQPIIFLPHLAGERAPVWNADARGVFVGLTTSTELRHLAAAVLEGVAFSARHALGECEKAAGHPADEIRLSGGGARSELWNQVKASAHGRPLLALATLDSAVLGATLMGIVAAGVEDDLVSAAERHVSVAGVIDPEPGETARLDDLYGAYRDAYEALVPVFSALARR